MLLNEIFSDDIGPSRIGMHHKDVTKRIPELTAAAEKVANGEMSRQEYQDLVRRFKPVEPYNTIPEPATDDAMYNALDIRKREKLNAPIEDGQKIGLRLDIPAYSDHGVWIPTIHGKSATISHKSTAIVNDVTMGFPETASLKIAKGDKHKSPIAKIEGYWENASSVDAIKQAKAALHDPDWIQVGMDPERHGYFYDRATEEPVVGGSRAIQVGGLVLVKNPIYGDREDYKYE